MHQQVHDLGVGADLGAVVASGGEEAHRHPHRVHRPVGDAHGRLELGIEVRLEAQGLGGRQALRGDAARLAALHERLQVLEVLLLDGDEEPVVALERTRADAPQDAVLLDALDGRLAIVDGIAPTAVEQPVVAPRRARGQLAALDQRDPHAPEGEIVGQRSTRAASTDDEDVPGAAWPGSHRTPATMSPPR